MNSKFTYVNIRTFDTYVEIYSTDAKQMLKFYYVWLRDHCKCPQCYNEKTCQITASVLKIPLNIKPSTCTIAEDALKITWLDGHKTEYLLHWLEDVSFPLKSKKEIVLWDKSNVSSFQDTQVSIDEYLKDDNGAKRLLNSLVKYGFGFVTGVEPTLEATKRVVEHIAPPQKTFFGEMWMVSNDYYHNDTAYTNTALGAHTDNTYFTEAAGLQIFQMFSHIGTGGETLLIDGFNVANNLKNTHPDAFEILCNEPIESHYIEEGYHFSTIEPVIKLHPLTKELFQIRYNIYDRATFNSVPHEKIPKYYTAYQLFGKEISNSKYEQKIKLMPGSVLFFDNWRVLHGRTAYTGKRDLGGCYVTRAEWLSKAKTLGLEIV